MGGAAGLRLTGYSLVQRIWRTADFYPGAVSVLRPLVLWSNVPGCEHGNKLCHYTA